MARRRAKHLDNAHHELESWASWVHLHQGENGVMGQQISNYDGITTDTPPKALIPRIDMPRHISLVERAYDDAPSSHKDTIRIKYLELGKVSRHSEDRMLEYISGVLFGGKYEASRAKKERERESKAYYKRAQVVGV